MREATVSRDSPRSCRLGFDQSLPLCLTLERVKPNLRTRLLFEHIARWELLGHSNSEEVAQLGLVNRLFSANASLYNPQRMVAGAPFSVVR